MTSGERQTGPQAAATAGGDPHRDVAILVPSCDAYSDLWVPFFTLFLRHWPTRRWKVYLGCNQGQFAHAEINVLHSTHGLKWAERTRDHLSQIPEPVVLLWLEDFFLRQDVDQRQVEAAYAAFVALDAHMLRLVSRPAPSPFSLGRSYGEIHPGAAYRASTQTAFWRKDTLLHLIEPGESIWQFEQWGSRRSDKITNGFYGVYKDILPYRHHVVEKGEWFPWNARHFGNMKIGCDFTRRRVMSRRTAAIWLMRKILSIGVDVTGIRWLVRYCTGRTSLLPRSAP